MVSQKEMPMEMNGSKDQGESSARRHAWGPRDTEKNVMGGWKDFLKGCFENQSLY